MSPSCRTACVPHCGQYKGREVVEVEAGVAAAQHADHCGGCNGRRPRPQSRSGRGGSRRQESRASRSSWWARRMWSGGNSQQHDDYRDLPIEIVHASERVTMEDSAAKAVRTKRDSSMRVASRLVRDGVRPGIRLGGQHRRGHGHRQDGAGRGARAWTGRRWPASFPRSKGTPVVVVDVGANVDCSPRMLAQFAVMGEIYSRMILRPPQAARGHSLHRRGGAQGQRADARRHAAAARASTSTSSATWKAATSTAATWT